MDFTRLAGLAGGHAEARAIQIALKLGLFEALKDGECEASALAHALGCDSRATMLLANALAALEILSLTGKKYALTASSRRMLIESSPEYLGGMILFDGALWEIWGRLEQSIRSGEPARAPDMYQSHPEETARFIRAMDSLVRARGDAVYTAKHLDLGFAHSIVDLGGGPGTYLVEFLRVNPQARGAIYDLPATLEVARRIIGEHAPWALERIELRAVDYREAELPGPADVVFMSNIIHSEDEATNAALVGKCFRVLSPDGLLVIKDHIMNPELTEPAAGAIFSLYLLLTTRGRDYSFSEVSEWLRAAGFRDVHHDPLPTPPFTSSLVIGRKK
ncbi:MAG TPA: methyltransferase [Candidatus Binataceae bacterium]|nr:methyltransferase [Candidatus Binataceae bacterium]